MITLFEGLPPHVAGFIASGKVTREDYDKVLIPRIEEVFKAHGHIHFLFQLNTEVGNFSASAWWKDLMIGLKHYSDWKRMAIVSDQESVNKISNAMGTILPGKTKGFCSEDIEAAKNWVAQEE